MPNAAKAGADAVLIVSPYNKPTQNGLYCHFTAVAGAVEVPVIVYDIPGRSIVRVSDDTLARMVADYPNIAVSRMRQVMLPVHRSWSRCLAMGFRSCRVKTRQRFLTWPPVTWRDFGDI